MGKLLWGYPPSVGEVGQRILDGWAKEDRRQGSRRQPLTLDLLKRVTHVLESICYNEFECLLFRTLKSWMFFRAFRVSELLAARRHREVTWDDIAFGHGHLVVRIRSSKTDKQGFGARVVLAAYPDLEVCPIRWARELKKTARERGQGVFRHQSGEGVSPHQLLGFLRAGLRRIGQNEVQFGTHSFWIGMATEAGCRGWLDSHIMVLGRWKLGAYRRYVRKGSPGFAV
ncbi:hypothetical protein NDU88_003324 [Pleurodeles waltl]|uniref:Tyr recombinase domain-containing protein n=1 Tax=Pleurodeles waltl TaxID=8319 RepID=A0AAV7MQ84_PLEWA|nr:hypothetical protein NDU88_003324 [Pleurodeles waltl]